MTTAPRLSRTIPTSWTRGAAGVLIMFLILEAITRAGLVNSTYLPPAGSIVVEAVRLLGRGEFWGALGSTLLASALGLLRAIAIAVPLGLLLGLSRWANRAAMTVVEMLRPIPSVALIPLSILVYGRGIGMKAFLVTFACIWPILFNTIYGMRDVDRVGTDTARAFGLGPMRTALRVHLPAASPFIYTGIKVAAAVALIVAIAAEIIGGGASGLGIEMNEARELSDLKASYAYTVITGVLGLLVYVSLEAIERRLFAWNRFDR